MAYNISDGDSGDGIILGNDTLSVRNGGTANDTTVNANGIVYVQMNGIANNTTVNSGGRMFVNSAGTASVITVNEKGFLDVSSGGAATGIEVAEGGSFCFAVAPDTHVQGARAGSAFEMKDGLLTGYALISGRIQVSGGGAVNDATVGASGALWISSGGVASGVTVSDNGGINVSSGGTASSIIVNENGRLILEGGRADSATVNESGTFQVKANATANAAVLNCSGFMYVSSGGTANDTTVNSGAGFHVSGGGTAGKVSVNAGGYFCVSSGGTAVEIQENGGYVFVQSGAEVTFLKSIINDLTLEKQSATVHSGTTACKTVLNSAGSFYVSSGGTANDTTVNSGYFSVFSGGTANDTIANGGWFYLESGGTANNTTVNKSGIFVVNQGALANSASLDGGDLDVISGGTLCSASINSGYFSVFSGGTAVEIRENGGYIDVEDGAVVTFVPNTIKDMVLEHTWATLHSGTTAAGVVIGEDAYVYVSRGGLVNGAAVENDGSLFVSCGGTANDVSVNEDGWFEIENGGAAHRITVNADGGIVVSCGGTATDITVNEGATYWFNVASDTYVQWTSGGQTFEIKDASLSDYTIGEGNSVYIHSGATASNISLEEYAYLCFDVASNTYVQWTSGGETFEMKDAFISDFTIRGGTRVYVSSGGTATNVGLLERALLGFDVASDTYVQWTSGGKTFEMKDAFISDFRISRGNSIGVLKGGIASQTVLLEGGTITVYDGGTANSTLMNGYGYLFVSSGGVANNTGVDKGQLHVSGGGVANGTVLNGGNLFISGGGTANGTVMSSGSFCVFSGGTANDTVINGKGWLHLSRGGTANNTVVNSGNLLVLRGGTANGIIINSIGRMTVDGGTVNSTTINSGGVLYIDEYDTVNSTTICSGGSVYVSSGATANGAIVSAGGRMTVSRGGRITGQMTFEKDATVSAMIGAVLDFDLTQTSAGASALVKGLSVIKGVPTYTLTVSGSQGAGVYTLAENAAGFTGTITVQNTHGAALGTLNAGETTFIGKDSYQLELADEKLTLTVKSPTTTNSAGDVLLANTMPEAEYMFGCAPTATAMLLGYYDLYGYRGKDFSALIEIDGETEVALKSRGTDGNKYNMNAFDTLLGRAIASEDYVDRFVSKDPIAVIRTMSYTETTPAEELPYSFVNDGVGPEVETKYWNCLADYLGTGQFWRGNENLATRYSFVTLEQILNDDRSITIIDGETMTQRTVENRYQEILYGLYLYARDKGYSLDMKVTGGYEADVAGGDFTFENYMREIDAGRPVLVVIDEHVMTGYGYNAETREIIFDDCYDADQRMVWDGVYNYADGDRSLLGIITVGFMSADTDIDLAVSPISEEAAASGKLIISTTENQLVSEDYCYLGSPLYLSFAVSNLGTSASGPFDVMIEFDGDAKEMLPSISLEPETLMRLKSIPLAADFGVGLHTVGVEIDPDKEIQETSGLNNTEKRSLMVLKEGTTVVKGTRTVKSGEVTGDDYVMNGAGIRVLDGGTAVRTLIQGKVTGRLPNGAVYFTPGIVNVSSGGLIRNAGVYEYGQLQMSGTAEDLHVFEYGDTAVFSGGIVSGVSVDKHGILTVESGGMLTGAIRMETGANVELEGGAVVNFDLTKATAGADALVNDWSVIRGTPDCTLTVSGTEANGVYKLAAGAADFTGSISVKDGAGAKLDTLTVGATATVNGTEYQLTNENGELSVTVTGSDAPARTKWTFLVYFAADNDLCPCALYDVVSMQQADLDPEIEIYVLVDRTSNDSPDNGDRVLPEGTYKWDSLWSDTRVGKVTASPGMTVTVDWESWGELDTGSIDTLERFVDWAQEKSPAENYGLVLWDHGGEDATCCFDLTTDPDWGSGLSVSGVSAFLKNKDNIPLVIFHDCLIGSELSMTQMAGSTEIVVASEQLSYSEATFNYNAFFTAITADMTAKDMARTLVQNVQSSDMPGAPTTLASVDVADTRLGDALEAFAEAVAASDNAADRTVLINAMLKAPQEGCVYDGSAVRQSDLGILIRDAMADDDYENTSDGFRTALAAVKTALESVVLEFRSMPSGRGTGLAFCNSVYTARKALASGNNSPEKISAYIKSRIIETYKSNPLWGGLLYDLCSTYLAEAGDVFYPPATFTVTDVDGLAAGRSVAVSDLGCFSGSGLIFNGIQVIDELYLGFVVTAEDLSSGSYYAGLDTDGTVEVSLLASDGSSVASGTGGVSFENLAPGSYYLCLQSEDACHVSLVSIATTCTGVDRFDYAGSGKNERNANGNGTIATATPLDDGYFTGLITYKGDTDYYRIGNIHTEKYQIELRGAEGLTVAEYDADGALVQSAVFADGKYTMTMDSMNYLFVEGSTLLESGLDPYHLNVTGLENGFDADGDVTLDKLAGSKDEVSWKSSDAANKYVVDFSTDSFDHALRFTTVGTAVDLLGLPGGTYQWRVKVKRDDDESGDAGGVADDAGDASAGVDAEEADVWSVGQEIVSDGTNGKPIVLQSKADASDDIFFATPNGTWSGIYCAKHVGSIGGWTGTEELVSAAGKGRIQDLFFGSADPGTLFLTDSDNGDALFLDDIYTGLPDEVAENTARLFRLHEIAAGAGDDIIDMTSQRFKYTGGALSISGGDGDDIIWANNGRNKLFGDAGNDRIIGAFGVDIIAGGSGNDRMHGGGGDDIFTFCENWGVDTVEQLADGTVTLWFCSGSMDNWDSGTLTYTDGANSVVVSGVSADRITLKFGEMEGTDTSLFEAYSDDGAFDEFTSRRIFEDFDNGNLA